MRSSPLNALALLLPTSTLGHSRWKCPEARSPSTGIKNGPCGGETNDFDLDQQQPLIEIKPGPLRVIFEESIYHTGAPFRISLSGDGSDDTSCVLLDHIPHNDLSPRPSFFDETTFTPYVITIDIPDVSCERCSLHLSNPMTDKIGSAGSPTGIGCTDPDGTCFSVYYSCTKPFRIVGTVPREEYECLDNAGFPPDWPTQWTGDGGSVVDTLEPGVYRRQSSIWSITDYTLETAPLRYRQDAGGICGEKDVDAGPSTSLPTALAESDAPTPAPVAIVLPAEADESGSDTMDNMEEASLGEASFAPTSASTPTSEIERSASASSGTNPPYSHFQSLASLFAFSLAAIVLF